MLATCREKPKTVTVSFVTGTDRELEPITRETNAYYGELPEPERSCYEFSGWYTEEDENNGVLVTETTRVMPWDITLYARWTFKEIEIEPAAVYAYFRNTYVIDGEGNFWSWGSTDCIMCRTERGNFVRRPYRL